MGSELDCVRDAQTWPTTEPQPRRKGSDLKLKLLRKDHGEEAVPWNETAIQDIIDKGAPGARLLEKHEALTMSEDQVRMLTDENGKSCWFWLLNDLLGRGDGGFFVGSDRRVVDGSDWVFRLGVVVALPEEPRGIISAASQRPAPGGS